VSLEVQAVLPSAQLRDLWPLLQRPLAAQPGRWLVAIGVMKLVKKLMIMSMICCDTAGDDDTVFEI